MADLIQPMTPALESVGLAPPGAALRGPAAGTAPGDDGTAHRPRAAGAGQEGAPFEKDRRDEGHGWRGEEEAVLLETTIQPQLQEEQARKDRGQ